MLVIGLVPHTLMYMCRTCTPSGQCNDTQNAAKWVLLTWQNIVAKFVAVMPFDQTITKLVSAYVSLCTCMSDWPQLGNLSKQDTFSSPKLFAGKVAIELSYQRSNWTELASLAASVSGSIQPPKHNTPASALVAAPVDAPTTTPACSNSGAP